VLTIAWSIADRWKGRIFLAFIDQGFASACNFLLTILCVAWLPLDHFGRYVLIWTASIFIENIQTSLLIDSLPAIVSQHGRTNPRRLDIAGTWIVLGYGALTSVLILLAIPVIALISSEFTLPLVCLAAINPAQRLYIWCRRLCYIRDRQDAAAAASVAYGLTLIAGVFGLFRLGLLSVPSLVLLWGLANGVASLLVFLKGIVTLQRARPATVAWLAVQLWRSGGWLAGSAVGYWITNWGMFPLVAAMAGSEAAGILRALQNLFTPLVQFNAALNLAMLPKVADKLVAVGQHYARCFALYGSILFVGIAALYSTVVLMASHTILTLAYKRPEIVAAAHLLWPVAIAASLEAARQASTMALLAAGRTRIFFIARVIAATAFAGSAVVLHQRLGFEGILWGVVISHLIGTAIVTLELRHIAKNPTPWGSLRLTSAT
jgi:O-antigen/teichoic acid export membrane protein